MAGLLTKETNRSVQDFIKNLEDQSKQADCEAILKLMTEATGLEPKVWGNEKDPDFMIGFGKYTYQRKGSKEEFEWFKVGFAPRKANFTIHLTIDVSREKELLDQLGKCKWGKGCLYINKLADVNPDILKELIQKSKND